jgi:hypothetical protein
MAHHQSCSDVAAAASGGSDDHAQGLTLVKRLGGMSVNPDAQDAREKESASHWIKRTRGQYGTSTFLFLSQRKQPDAQTARESKTLIRLDLKGAKKVNTVNVKEFTPSAA